MPLLMKVPKLGEGADPAAIVSFEMELMIMPRLTGEHVPKFVAAGDLAVQPYIVMELIPGHTLLSRVPDLPLPYDEVAAIGVKVACALDDLHRQHVVHLDVKPGNIMFRPDGAAVMLDFGLSRHDQLPDLMQAEFRLPFGTAPYMAPEQLLGVRQDPRSDVFALGVLLYFFSTGERPFGESEPWPACAGGCGVTPIRRAGCGRTIRPGSRKLSCAASRPSRPGAIRPPRRSHSSSATPRR
jgi:serine/threonine protein kinase